MKLLIKQRIFSWRDSYDVYDESGEAKYTVKSEPFSFGHQLHVYDRNQKEVGVIHQKLLALLPAFEIESTEGAEERFKSSLPFLSRGMKSIITAGVWKGMFLAGTMMFTTDTAS